jgi:hypothetical protein
MADDGGLFNIEISSSDESTTPPKALRDYQSEANFQLQKAEWKPKIEQGQVILINPCLTFKYALTPRRSGGR